MAETLWAVDPHQSITLSLSAEIAKAASHAVELIVAELEGFAEIQAIERTAEIRGVQETSAG